MNAFTRQAKSGTKKEKAAPIGTAFPTALKSDLAAETTDVGEANNADAVFKISVRIVETHTIAFV